jgi:hypothetical protein
LNMHDTPPGPPNTPSNTAVSMPGIGIEVPSRQSEQDG